MLALGLFAQVSGHKSKLWRLWNRWHFQLRPSAASPILVIDNSEALRHDLSLVAVRHCRESLRVTCAFPVFVLPLNLRLFMPHFCLFRPQLGTRFVGSGSRGFALVIALSLMAFVVLLLLSIATLLRVEQMGADTARQQLEAEQVALLSLNLAIARLQETAGLDQRVTAPAASVASVNGPQELIGVWRSWEGLDHDTTTGLPSAELGGVSIYDLKLEAGDLKDASDVGRFLGWLVSSVDDPTNIISYQAAVDSPPSLEEVDGITVPLVSTGSVTLGTNPSTGIAETAADVEVHLRPTVIADGDAAMAW